MNKTIICVTDLHLTLNNFEKKTKILIQKINKIDQNSTLIFLGDIIDESHENYSKGETKQLISKLRELFSMIKNREIILTPGNHDDGFFYKYKKDFPISIVDSITIENYTFMHGHQFDKRLFIHKIVRLFKIKYSYKKIIKPIMKKLDTLFEKRKKKAHTFLSKKFKDKHTLIIGHFDDNKTYSIDNKIFIILQSSKKDNDEIKITKISNNQIISY